METFREIPEIRWQANLGHSAPNQPLLQVAVIRVHLTTEHSHIQVYPSCDLSNDFERITNSIKEKVKGFNEV